MMAIVRLLQRQIEPTFLIQTSPYARRLGELYSVRQQLHPENATNIIEPGWVIMDYVMLPQRIVKAFDQPSCRGFMNRHESKIRRSTLRLSGLEVKIRRGRMLETMILSNAGLIVINGLISNIGFLHQTNIIWMSKAVLWE